MTIDKLTASFGKLENETLKLHEGLNLIYAPNESGKSTWCAFIRAMLYGVDSAERTRAGYLPDKLRYAPWSGAPMEGSMELRAKRCGITLTRSTRAKNAPMREFSATYTGTNTPVEGMTGENAGELLTGVTREVFRRSAFIAQGTVAVTGSPELEKRINAIVSTGEEQTSYSEADGRLRQWLRARRFNRRGLLPELEAKMDDAQRRLGDMGGSLRDVEELERRLEAARQNCGVLEQQVNDSRRLQRRESLERLNAGRAEAARLSQRHDAAMEALAEKRQALRGSRFGGADGAGPEAEARQDLAALEELKARSRKKPSALLAVICFILAVAGAALYTHLDKLVFVIGAGLFCVAAVALLFRFSKARTELNDVREQRRQILKKYQAASSSDILLAMQEGKELRDGLRQAEQEELECREAYEAAQAALSSLEESALAELDFTTGSTEAARLSRELAKARADAARLSEQIAGMNGRLAALGDPLVISSSLSCMQEEYEQISDEYDALALAIETLKEADAELQSRFSPELGRVAAGYMSLVTGGRYADVLINRDFTARTRTQDDAVARDAEYLSAGTLDLMYLAVRLAVCELALPEGESCPLIIDDALVNLDETRMKQALELLRQIAQERQVILFTCRK